MANEWVLFYITSASVGGAEYDFLNILKYIAENNCNFKTLVYSPSAPMQLKYKKYASACHIVPNNKLLHFVKLFFLIIKYKPKIIYSNLLLADFFSSIASKLLNVKVISKKHGHFNLEKTAFKYLEKISLFLSYMIIFPSYYLLDEYINYYKLPSKKTKVIYNGVYIPENDIVPKKLKKKINIISVSRLVKEKRHEIMIGVIREIVGRFNWSDIEFTIIGDGPLMGYIDNMIKDNKLEEFIKLQGILSKNIVYDKLSQSDFYVQFSSEENISIALLEAMSFGNICFVSEVGGMKEIIKDNYNGFIISENNIPFIADKLIDVINNYSSYYHIKENAKRTVMEMFSIKKEAQNLINIFETVK